MDPIRQDRASIMLTVVCELKKNDRVIFTYQAPRICFHVFYFGLFLVRPTSARCLRHLGPPRFAAAIVGLAGVQAYGQLLVDDQD